MKDSLQTFMFASTDFPTVPFAGYYGAIVNGSPRFNSLLRVALERSGLTQREFAKKAGFSQGFPPLLLAGKRTPPLDKLEQMADALGLSGQPRQEFMDAAHAAHSSEHLVTEYRQRGQEIDRLTLKTEFYERIITTPDEVTDAEERSAAEQLSKPDLVEQVVLLKRANRKLTIRAWPRRPRD